jgi:hypothetical protein
MGDACAEGTRTVVRRAGILPPPTGARTSSANIGDGIRVAPFCGTVAPGSSAVLAALSMLLAGARAIPGAGAPSEAVDSAPVQVRPARTPDSLGKYRIVERLSENLVAECTRRGSTGSPGSSVPLSSSGSARRTCATRAFAAALVDEAKLAGLLSHANIVQILDLGEADGTTYIAMELVDGIDLDRILTRAYYRGSRSPTAMRCRSPSRS